MKVTGAVVFVTVRLVTVMEVADIPPSTVSFELGVDVPIPTKPELLSTTNALLATFRPLANVDVAKELMKNPPLDASIVFVFMLTEEGPIFSSPLTQKFPSTVEVAVVVEIYSLSIVVLPRIDCPENVLVPVKLLFL